MDESDLRLRTLLMDIGDRLSNDDRSMLSFLLSNDVPRRDLDTVARDSRASMNPIWEALINRQKITANNVNYLIVCFEKIRRIDLVRRLKQYSSTSQPERQTEQARNSSDLFVRIDP